MSLLSRPDSAGATPRERSSEPDQSPDDLGWRSLALAELRSVNVSAQVVADEGLARYAIGIEGQRCLVTSEVGVHVLCEGRCLEEVSVVVDRSIRCPVADQAAGAGLSVLAAYRCHAVRLARRRWSAKCFFVRGSVEKRLGYGPRLCWSGFFDLTMVLIMCMHFDDSGPARGRGWRALVPSGCA